MYVRDLNASTERRLAMDATLWRYMDIARFLSILEHRAIHFARADQMPDKWEGVYGDLNRRLSHLQYSQEDASRIGPPSATVRHSSRQRATFMSCWHQNEYESAAMWDIYQREGRGVAIRTTWQRLAKSLNSPFAIVGGRVNYVDYARTILPEANLFIPFMNKRTSFGHEREVRLLLTPIAKGFHQLDQFCSDSVEGAQITAIPIPADLDELIECIYVAPDAPGWVVDLITKVSKRYGAAAGIVQSDLMKAPIL